jgi:hypothetical protein
MSFRSQTTCLDEIERFQKEGGAYAMIQGTRPRTPAAALNDSPAGLAAWIVEKFYEWSDCAGDIETRFTKDELLTNIMLYWTTQTIESSFQPYRDVMKAGALRWTMEAAKGWVGSSKTPAGFALFPKDISTPPREWAERFYNVQPGLRCRAAAISRRWRNRRCWPKIYGRFSGRFGNKDDGCP